MKNLIRLILIIEFLSLNNLNSQEIISELNESNKLEAVKITEIQDKTEQEIYKAVLDWTSYTFRNTESVIQAQVENEMIRLNGISSGVLDGPMGFNYGLGYTIQIEIKPNKLRFRVYDLNMIGVDAARTKTPMELTLLKRNGKKRSSTNFEKYKIDSDNEINRIYKSLYESITNDKKEKSDW
ncbi:MAG: hypothetical protein CVU08_06495 [Bacteroidetes bacterium HGW-Bacteroidetes-3]|jgi:hypothetical protein|nr:MAG: hypothetical protein CVU08_06495 [Bacteroidetes bacterium HGW-Bacteroidetes-3]